MFQTNQKAQSALEYLMTYGWALVLIAAVIGVLVFIVSSPASEVTFSSSDPMKILMKGGAVEGTTTRVKLINATGGEIEINNIMASGASYSNCTVNGEASVEVKAGSVMELECPLSGADPAGSITI